MNIEVGQLKLFDYLMIKKQRESYIKELGERQKQIQLMYNKINLKRDYVNELKNKPSYDLLSSLDGVNKVLRDQFEKKGMLFTGISPDNKLPEIIELKNHPWFVGVQYHPEFKSRPLNPHPLFSSFIKAAKSFNGK